MIVNGTYSIWGVDVTLCYPFRSLLIFLYIRVRLYLMVALTCDHHFIVALRLHLNSFRVDALLFCLLLGTFATVCLLGRHVDSEPILIQLHRLSSL